MPRNHLKRRGSWNLYRLDNELWISFPVLHRRWIYTTIWWWCAQPCGMSPTIIWLNPCDSTPRCDNSGNYIYSMPLSSTQSAASAQGNDSFSNGMNLNKDWRMNSVICGNKNSAEMQRVDGNFSQHWKIQGKRVRHWVTPQIQRHFGQNCLAH